jgi:hypothetical protein
MSKRRVIVVGIVLPATLILLFPFQITIVPEWQARVVNESHEPLKRVTVAEYWRYSVVSCQGKNENSITDDYGFVKFPKRTVRIPILLRMLRPVIQTLGCGLHDSSQPYGFLVVSRDGNLYDATGNIYIPGHPPPQEVIVK